MKKILKIFLVILLYSSVIFTASADDYDFDAAHDRWHKFAENAMKSAQNTERRVFVIHAIADNSSSTTELCTASMQSLPHTKGP